MVRRGGVAANIAFGMGQLGLRPVLVGAVGADFADYRAWLERHGVDCDSVHVSEVAHTARFVCTTDDDMCQIASFYAGAMSEARNIELAPVAERLGGLDLVLISAERPGRDDPALARSAASAAIAFAADPSQQLARMSGEDVRQLIDGAELPADQRLREGPAGVQDRADRRRGARPGRVRVTTLGKDGVRITGRGLEPIHVPVAKEIQAYDPTGVGDGFRAGFFAGAVLGAAAGAVGPGRLAAGHAGAGDGRHRRSTRCAPTTSPSGSPSPTATTAAADVRLHLGV